MYKTKVVYDNDACMSTCHSHGDTSRISIAMCMSRIRHRTLPATSRGLRAPQSWLKSWRQRVASQTYETTSPLGTRTPPSSMERTQLQLGPMKDDVAMVDGGSSHVPVSEVRPGVDCAVSTSSSSFRRSILYPVRFSPRTGPWLGDGKKPEVRLHQF